MSDMNLQHPEITWAERTGFPSWCQEVLGEFEEEDLPLMCDRNEIILDAIPWGKENAITRPALAARTGWPDRAVRRSIEELRRAHIILNDQDGKGYYRSYDLQDIYRAYRQERARALAILYRLQPMRILLKGGGLV